MIASLFLVFPLFCIDQLQPQPVLCSAGNGNFEAEFPTGVKVHIGAARNGALATRSCTANLSWGNQSLVVAESAVEVDLDAFGTDFGDGIPVAAFQIKRADSDCCIGYAVYSLQKPPRLLRTLTGGQFFNASDVDLDGTIEIFTDDAAAVNGFEKLTLGEMDWPPTIVLRLEKTHLRDVSAEFQPYFDDQIRNIRATIDPHYLEDFRNSEGALTGTSTGSSTERLHHLRTVKIKVLEIVWAYLYSGREQEAWRSLTAMWPSADIDRIRAALSGTRARGIHGEADSASVGPPRHKNKHAQVFDAVNRPETGGTLEVVPPEAILLQRPPVSQQNPELLLQLVIDRAGKVRSVEPVGKAKWADPELISAAHTWKFIPAFKDGRAVASRLRIAVSPRQ
jgi:hypothetical protein